MIPNIGPLEIAIVLIIALVVFGPKKLPELGKSVGNGLKEFKSSISDSDPAPAPAIESGVTKASVSETETSPHKA